MVLICDDGAQQVERGPSPACCVALRCAESSSVSVDEFGHGEGESTGWIRSCCMFFGDIRAAAGLYIYPPKPPA